MVRCWRRGACRWCLVRVAVGEGLSAGGLRASGRLAEAELRRVLMICFLWAGDVRPVFPSWSES